MLVETRSLLRRFREQRPIRGGSLLITIFGDAIAPRGGVVTLGSLIELAAPFGLTERLVRTSVARLAQDGWLVARRDGRRSEYRLTDGGQERFAEATRRIYAEGPASWDGRWTLVLLCAARGKQREAVREGLRWLGFGQLGPGLFAHPNSSAEAVNQWLRTLDGTLEPVVLTSTSGDLTVDRRVVRSGWNLGELAQRYRRFVRAFAALEAREAAAFDPQSAFVIRTLLIHDYRKIHLRDPLLPPALLPRGWVGSRAYSVCGSLYSKVFAASERYLNATASTLEQPLPPLESAALERFGGILRSARP